MIDARLAEDRSPWPWRPGRRTWSPERYRHLFVEALGLPYRRYLLWRRVQRPSALKDGDDVTTAAHAAGFADAAHFARTPEGGCSG